MSHMSTVKYSVAERTAFTIREFCARNGISTPTYFDLRAKDRGPKEMRLGTAVRISARAELEWQAARESPIGAEADDVARAAAMTKRRAAKASHSRNEVRS